MEGRTPKDIAAAYKNAILDLICSGPFSRHGCLGGTALVSRVFVGGQWTPWSNDFMKMADAGRPVEDRQLRLQGMGFAGAVTDSAQFRW